MEIKYKGHYLNGEFFLGKGRKKRQFSPGDLKDCVIEWFSDSSFVNEACEKGKEASVSWGKTSLEERKEKLFKLKTLFEQKSSILSEVISRETGKPLWESEKEVQALSQKVEMTLNLSLKRIETQKISPGASVKFKPYGLFAVIGPFNFPMHLPNGQILAALLSGNAVIFKPSEQTPASGQLLTECFAEVFPPGVFQMLQGGAELSEKLCAHPLVDGILFTGSFQTGLKIQKWEEKQKRVALEMGGKNSTFIWDCEDLNLAVKACIEGSFWTAGQRCSSTSSIILNQKIAPSFKKIFLQKVKELSVGHWRDNPFMGSLIDSVAVERFFSYQEEVKKTSSVLIEGKKLPGGHYVSPGVYGLEFDSNSLFQSEETFTPQVGIYEVKEWEEALPIISHSGYGLVLSFFSQDEALKKELFEKTKAGLFYVNRSTVGASPELPFGGVGRSGNGRPAGVSMIESCVYPVSCWEGK